MGCCDLLPICVAGKTYNAVIQYDPQGGFQSGHYLDLFLVKQPLTAGTFTFGVCPIVAPVAVLDTVRIITNLVVGNNVLVHNLGKSVVTVDARDNATGSWIDVRVVAENINSTTVFVPVLYNNVRFTIRTIGVQ
jgi:hypothetical protein